LEIADQDLQQRSGNHHYVYSAIKEILVIRQKFYRRVRRVT